MVLIQIGSDSWRLSIRSPLIYLTSTSVSNASSLGLSVNRFGSRSSVPLVQLMIAFWLFSQGRPRIAVSFPNDVANCSDFYLSLAMTRSPVTLWVIVPFTLGVPSTLNTGIG